MKKPASWIIVVALAIAVVIAIRELPELISPDRGEEEPWPTSVEPFVAPEVGQEVRIELVSGSSRKGVIRKLFEDAVTIETADGEVTYQRTVMAPVTRQLLFEKDHMGEVDEVVAPSLLTREDIARLLASGKADPEDLGLASNAQYVISGTNAIVIYESRIEKRYALVNYDAEGVHGVRYAVPP